MAGISEHITQSVRIRAECLLDSFIGLTTVKFDTDYLNSPIRHMDD